MSKRADKDFLRDIREAIDRIETYVMGMTDTEFMADYKTQDAVVRNWDIATLELPLLKPKIEEIISSE